MYTDGSKEESNRSGSGTFIEKLARYNPENCSVFRSELKPILNRTGSSNVRIPTDSRRAIQHLQGWTRVDDVVSIRIINKLKTMGKYKDVNFQWISSHVNVPGNDVADFLAKSCSEIATTDYALAYREIYSLIKIKVKQIWIAPPDHPGISRKSPGGALEFDGNRNDQTAVSKLLSGHSKGITFKSDCKVFQTCSKCHLLPASPERILDCLGLALELSLVFYGARASFGYTAPNIHRSGLDEKKRKEIG
ncbi:RNase H domain-containing protein [Trichonephila inaurata madagascariensis]|uniref:RNase H domain-containing protein n=1 Tax=Trichonephila inaurata madagascariensis TaxID=2747483 RepID=A0A8X7C0M1_9ARAC|nr:RNase H domain-containing protein [Trichonephila inaurata madagascariensis]